MAIRSAKHKAPQGTTFVLNGGLNYAQSPANIAQNELKRAYNFIYNASTDKLETRPGTSCQTATALGSPILIGYYYEKTSTTGYHVCASGGKLYYLSGASLNAWTEIGALADSTTVPSFVTFNSKLLIADGGADIKTWDGTTFTTISGSPKANALAIINNRVVCNATDEADSVYFSAPNDAESSDAWNTSLNAVGLRAGYGDLLAVNAFGVYGDDLIVSKLGNSEKRIYRINVADATPANWYVQVLSHNNAAKNARAVAEAWNNVYYVDSNGFKSIKGIRSYGDLEVDYIGSRINTNVTPAMTCDFVSYLPSLNAVWFAIGSRVFSYTERVYATTQDGQTTMASVPAFTDMYFQWGRPTSVYEVSNTIYITGYNGYLYVLDDDLDTDEVTPGVTDTYLAAVRTKTMTPFVDMILRKVQWYISPKSEGTGNLYACREENAKVRLKEFTITEDADLLYEATGYLDAATEDIYDTGVSPWVETARNRVRSDEMAFELEVTSGRCSVELCKVEYALVEGGD